MPPAAWCPRSTSRILNSKIDGRIDVTRDTQILLENRFIVCDRQSRQPEPAGRSSRKLPINQDVGGTLGLAQEINRLTFTLKGTIDRATYDPSLLTNGQHVDQRRSQLRSVCRNHARSVMKSIPA